MTLHDDLCDLATAQHGVVSFEQARALAATPSALTYLRSGRNWTAGPGRVLIRRGSADTEAQQLMAAVLDVGGGAFLSHTTAAAWWGLSGFSRSSHPDLHVSRARGATRRTSPLAIVHQVRDLEPDHVVEHRGIRTSTPARTVFELASMVHLGRAERACDNALAMGLVSVRGLHRMLEDWADHGRSGTVAMRSILDERPVGYQPPASNLESRFHALAGRYLLGPFRRQVDLGDSDDWIGRVDFVHTYAPLVVEVQSQRHHSSLTDERVDAERFAKLHAAGFVVVAVWDDELWNNPGPAMERVFQALQQARASAA